MSNTPSNIVYTALFVVDPRRLLEIFEPVHKKVFGHHSTIAFRPDSLEGIEMGRRHTIAVIGRVVDEKGDALLVDNSRSDNQHPHITLSVAAGTEPVYSNKLLETAAKDHLIEYYQDPVMIDVVEGYFDGERDVIA